MSIHINDLKTLIRKIFDIYEPGDDPFEPKLFVHSGNGPEILIPQAQKLALCPGSIMLSNVSFNEQFSKAIAGINVQLAFLSTTLRGDFVNKRGELKKNQPFFGSTSFVLFFFRCPQAKIDELVETLGVHYNTSVFLVMEYRHSHAALDNNVSSDDYECVSTKRKRKKKF